MENMSGSCEKTRMNENFCQIVMHLQRKSARSNYTSKKVWSVAGYKEHLDEDFISQRYLYINFLQTTASLCPHIVCTTSALFWLVIIFFLICQTSIGNVFLSWSHTDQTEIKRFVLVTTFLTNVQTSPFMCYHWRFPSLSDGYVMSPRWITDICQSVACTKHKVLHILAPWLWTC